MVTNYSRPLFIKVYQHFVITSMCVWKSVKYSRHICLNQTQDSDLNQTQRVNDQSLKCDQYQVMVGTLFQQICAFPVMPTTVVPTPMSFSEAMRQ